jgi:hypothetical protein
MRTFSPHGTETVSIVVVDEEVKIPSLPTWEREFLIASMSPRDFIKVLRYDHLNQTIVSVGIVEEIPEEKNLGLITEIYLLCTEMSGVGTAYIAYYSTD